MNHPKEVMAAIRRLKQQHLTSLFTVTGMESVYLMTGSDEEDHPDDEATEVRWAEY